MVIGRAIKMQRKYKINTTNAEAVYRHSEDVEESSNS